MKEDKVKSKGRKAWLVTWEGDEFGMINRPQVVAVLPPRLGERNFKFILELLYNSEHPHTLCEKVAFGLGNKQEKPNYFRYNYRDINPEMLYGDHHCFLKARQVRDLICEENAQNPYKCTLTCTELQKFRDVVDSMEEPKVVMEERQVSYTYITERPSLPKSAR